MLVVRDGMLLNLAGVGFGLAGALALAGTMSGFQFRIPPTDATTFAGVVLMFATVALLANLPPRAARGLDRSEPGFPVRIDLEQPH